MRYLASATLTALGIMALTPAPRQRSSATTKAIAGTPRKGTITAPNSTSRSIPMIGAGRRPTMESTIGASMKVPVIGRAASGSGSKRRRLERNFCRVRSLSESFGKDARPSPEPIARSGKRRREPDTPSGFFFALCTAVRVQASSGNHRWQ
jgi:hypothetical protein